MILQKNLFIYVCVCVCVYKMFVCVCIILFGFLIMCIILFIYLAVVGLAATHGLSLFAVGRLLMEAVASLVSDQGLVWGTRASVLVVRGI